MVCILPFILKFILILSLNLHETVSICSYIFALLKCTAFFWNVGLIYEVKYSNTPYTTVVGRMFLSQ